jgi:pyruvate dehydrogenase E2 component (dihydrolipoamide acetyltransferase)
MNAPTATAIEMQMPRLSDSMEEGTILTWLIAPGQLVQAGDDLVEIETDKANMTVAAEASGVLEILAEEGATLAVGAPIARFGLGEGSGGLAAQPAPAAATAPPAPAAPRVSEKLSTAAGADRPASEPGSRPPATPLARRAARIHGVDLAGVGGGGPRGRITKADVIAAAGVEGARGGVTIEEPTRLQAVIARRMAEAKATVPHFQVQTEVKMDEAIALRRRLKAIAGEAPTPSFNDLIVKAAAFALREHPKANASYRDSRFELHARINIGVAVAAEDALLVPTIADADQKSLGEIARESRRLAGRARSGEITPPELAGGTFTVSNLGMFGMTAIFPVINLPQAAILGVGMTRQVLVRGEDGEIEDAAVMTLTLSCDHRILYGAEAADFLSEVRDLLESPLRLAL